MKPIASPDPSERSNGLAPWPVARFSGPKRHRHAACPALSRARAPALRRDAAAHPLGSGARQPRPQPLAGGGGAPGRAGERPLGADQRPGAAAAGSRLGLGRQRALLLALGQGAPGGAQRHGRDVRIVLEQGLEPVAGVVAGEQAGLEQLTHGGAAAQQEAKPVRLLVPVVLGADGLGPGDQASREQSEGKALTAVELRHRGHRRRVTPALASSQGLVSRQPARIHSPSAQPSSAWTGAPPGGALHSKHGLEHIEHLHQRGLGQNSQELHQAFTIHGP